MIKQLWTAVLKKRKHEQKIKRLVFCIDFFLGRFEKKILTECSGSAYPPIFIVGSPRSGSTLLYQLMARRFRLCYFSNLMMSFPNALLIVAKLMKNFDNFNPPDSFSSNYGYTYGWNSPNQGGRFWTRFYQADDNVDVLSAHQSQEIRRTILCLQGFYNAPFVNKWQRNTTKLNALNNIFSNSLFIVTKRDPAATARSILEGRRKLIGDERQWFSTKPNNFEELTIKAPLQQVCGQVYELEKSLDSYRKIIGENRFFYVQYEKIIISPHSVLNSINDFYRKNSGSNLAVRHNVPSAFSNSNLKWLNDPEYQNIKACLYELEQEGR